MTKTKLTVARLVMAVILIVSLTALATFAFADEATEPQTRTFDKRFDRMLDDASGTDGVLPAYRHIVWQAGQADDVTDPVYKLGSAKLADEGLASITLTVRSSQTKIADLRLGLRLAGVDKDEACAIVDLSNADYPVEFSSGEDIGTDWTEMTFDFSQWDDIQFNDDNHTKFSDEGVKIEGFHLFSDSSKGGELDIQKVECTVGSSTTILQNFSGEKNMYWDGGEAGTFTDFGRRYNITSTKAVSSDVATSNNLDGKYNAVVLSVAGTGTVTVAPIKGDGSKGEAKAWANLTDLNGTAVPAITATRQDIVVSLDSLGEKAVKGVEFNVSGGELNVFGVFFTNLEVPAVGEAPHLDTESIAYMTKFGFDADKIDGDYDQAIEKYSQYGLTYILSYGGATNVKVTNGHLVFDNTSNAQEYIQAKVRSTVGSEGRRYLVLKYKLEDGATLDNFRFAKLDTNDGSSDIIYANQMKSAEGVDAWSDSNPYYSASGYSYLVVDTVVTFGNNDVFGLDMYYSGAGKLSIDEIFYANQIVPEAELSENFIGEPRVKEIPVGVDYQYLDGFELDGQVHDGIAVTLKGSEGTSLSQLRLQFQAGSVSEERWVFENTAGVLRDVYGNMFPDITTEEQVYMIDYKQSNITPGTTNLYFHFTQGEVAQTITIESIQYFDYKTMDVSDEVLAEDFQGKEFTADATGYKYVGWASGEARTGMDFALLEVEGNISKLRLGMDAETIWFEENTAGTFVDKDGNMFDLTETGKRTLVIDLAKSGVPATITDIHFHNDFANVGDVIKITSLKFAKDLTVPYEDILKDIPVNDDAKPTVDTFEVSATGTVGKEISVTVTASDNYSAASALETTVTVTREGNAVTVSGNKFTPDQAGTYTVTVKVKDEAGNEITESKTVTVSAQSSQPSDPSDNPSNPSDPSDPTTSEKDGLPGWAIALIVVGAILVVGGAVACVLIIKKKKSK